MLLDANVAKHHSRVCLLPVGAINKLVECFRMFHNGHFWDGVFNGAMQGFQMALRRLEMHFWCYVCPVLILNQMDI